MRSRLKQLYWYLYLLVRKYQCCPFCNQCSQSFLPVGLDLPVLREKQVVGGGFRLRVTCPTCGSSDRDRLVYLYLLNKTRVFQEKTRLLHVAPESGLQRKFRQSPNLRTITVDLYASSVMLRADLTAIPHPSNAFDAIICNHVLEHIPDDRLAMSEIYRVLRPEGWAILQVPISPTLSTTYEDWSKTTSKAREEAFGQFDHVRIYAADYKARLQEAGFTVQVFRWTCERSRFGGYANLFALNKKEVVFVARKPPVASLAKP